MDTSSFIPGNLSVRIPPIIIADPIQPALQYLSFTWQEWSGKHFWKGQGTVEMPNHEANCGQGEHYYSHHLICCLAQTLQGQGPCPPRKSICWCQKIVGTLVNDAIADFLWDGYECEVIFIFPVYFSLAVKLRFGNFSLCVIRSPSVPPNIPPNMFPVHDCSTHC